MKKIMFICSSQVSLPPKKGGGVEDVVFEIARHVKKEFKPLVVSRKRFDEDGVECINVPSKIRKNKIAAIAEDFFYGIKCLGEIKIHRPDVIHLNTTFTSLPISIFLCRGGSKIVYTSHSPSWTVHDSEIGFLNKIFSAIETVSIKRADKVTAVSGSMRNGIIKKAKIDAEKIITVPNFSKPEEFSPKYGKKWKKSKEIKGVMVLFVGKLTETKGVGYLIESIPAVLKQSRDTVFVFVGGMEHEQELSKNKWTGLVKKLGVEKNVIFLGNVSREEIPKIYSSADIFVLPTMREGMPLVILEAAASGVPIITTKISGIPEIIDEKAAIFVPRRNAGALARAITKVIANPSKAGKMGLEARKSAIKFRKESVLGKYEVLYNSL